MTNCKRIHNRIKDIETIKREACKQHFTQTTTKEESMELSKRQTECNKKYNTLIQEQKHEQSVNNCEK